MGWAQGRLGWAGLALRCCVLYCQGLEPRVQICVELLASLQYAAHLVMAHLFRALLPLPCACRRALSARPPPATCS